MPRCGSRSRAPAGSTSAVTLARPERRRIADLAFRMTQEDGQWRIAKAPDALIVDDWFQDATIARRRSTSSTRRPASWCPEPVFVPEATSRPRRWSRRCWRARPAPRRRGAHFRPARAQPGLSVPVNDDGVAEITLQGEAGQLTAQSADLMVNQFAWTLEAGPVVSSFDDHHRRRAADPAAAAASSAWTSARSTTRPTSRASSLLFAVRDGVLESGRSRGHGPGRRPVRWPPFVRRRRRRREPHREPGRGRGRGGTALCRGPGHRGR